MRQLTVTIVASNKAIVVDENGKQFEVVASFHARTLKGEYKYHEVYVYLNKLDEFKDEFKAPKTLAQKWKYDEETRKFKSLGQAGIKILNYTEVIGKTMRTKFDLNEIEYDFE